MLLPNLKGPLEAIGDIIMTNFLGFTPHSFVDLDKAFL
jgi:hypothetical protein